MTTLARVAGLLRWTIRERVGHAVASAVASGLVLWSYILLTRESHPVCTRRGVEECLEGYFAPGPGAEHVIGAFVLLAVALPIIATVLAELVHPLFGVALLPYIALLLGLARLARERPGDEPLLERVRRMRGAGHSSEVSSREDVEAEPTRRSFGTPRRVRLFAVAIALAFMWWLWWFGPAAQR